MQLQEVTFTTLQLMLCCNPHRNYCIAILAFLVAKCSLRFGTGSSTLTTSKLCQPLIWFMFIWSSLRCLRLFFYARLCYFLCTCIYSVCTQILFIMHTHIIYNARLCYLLYKRIYLLCALILFIMHAYIFIMHAYIIY
uniref:Uncharacterized protein n=1 Tax=Parascaris univalens TaxID=6257 RepID=A0A915A0E0_PARUN